jgi:regulator of protease activity HflC (stomatin/prohibitin superfamily)
MILFIIGFILLVGSGFAYWFLKWDLDNIWSKLGSIGGMGFGILIMTLNLVTFINPGEVGVVVDLFGSDRGVEDKEITVGMHIVMPWKRVYVFPIFEQNHQWTGNEKFTFQTSEGLSVSSEVGITYNLVPSRIHELFSKYRRGMDEITHLFVRNNIRDAMNRYSSRMKIEELYGEKKEDFFTKILTDVNTELSPLGFNISHIYIIGQFDVPPTVKEALNKKIEAIQRAQQRENELREAEAQSRKEVALAEGESKSKLIKAKADAEANALLTRSLNDELLRWEAINKWDGKLPTTMMSKEVPFVVGATK